MDARDAVLAALAKMAALRQAEVSGKTLALYATELATAHVPTDVVVHACRRIQMRERSEGETAFPSLGTLLDECRIVAAKKADDEEARLRKRLPPAPLTDAQWAEIRRQFQTVLNRRSMR